MFLDEAHLAARIRHPNVVPIIDVVSEDGELFLVMEFVLGESLSTCLRARAGKGLELPIAAAILRDVLLALHAAHETRADDGALLEIVHRDVSPPNVIVGADGHARVIDFGIARAVGRLQTTREGEIRGKAGYLAPEQVRTEPLDRRTDIFAAGVVFWETLTGRRLFMADTPLGAMTRILQDTPPAPSKFVAVPTAIDAIAARALEKDPSARYATAREMADAISSATPCASEQEIAAFVRVVGGAGLVERERRAREIARREGHARVEPKPRARWKVPAIVVAALVGAPLALYTTTHRATSGTQSHSTTTTESSMIAPSSPLAARATEVSSSTPAAYTEATATPPLASHKTSSAPPPTPSASAALRVDCNPPWEWVDTLSGPEKRIKPACIATRPIVSARGAP